MLSFRENLICNIIMLCFPFHFLFLCSFDFFLTPSLLYLLIFCFSDSTFSLRFLSHFKCACYLYSHYNSLSTFSYHLSSPFSKSTFLSTPLSSFSLQVLSPILLSTFYFFLTLCFSGLCFLFSCSLSIFFFHLPYYPTPFSPSSYFPFLCYLLYSCYYFSYSALSTHPHLLLYLFPPNTSLV